MDIKKLRFFGSDVSKKYFMIVHDLFINTARKSLKHCTAPSETLYGKFSRTVRPLRVLVTNASEIPEEIGLLFDHLMSEIYCFCNCVFWVKQKVAILYPNL